MKKLLALLLSVIMAMSLAVPAFADGPDGPPALENAGYFVDGSPAPVYTPGEGIPISAILNEAESLGIIGGADGPTAIITSGFDLESFKWDGYDLEGLDPDATNWAELAKELEKLAQESRDELKKSLGGVAGQIGVMVNGEYVKFPDAAPEIVSGRTMVPVRALVEALGGEVDYRNDDVLCKMNGMTAIFTIGSKEATVDYPVPENSDEATGGVIEMDCAPYIKDGRTYVPVRFIAEALGYEVGWDGRFQTAILLDRSALAAEIDKEFTILNRVLAASAPATEEGKSCRTQTKGSVTVTAFDTLNGDKSYTADLSSKLLANGDAASGSFSLKLSDNIADMLVGQYGYMDDEALERMELMVKALEDAELVMTREGQMWVHASALDELAGEKNIWCGMNMDRDETQIAFAGMGTGTVGSAFAAMMGVDSVREWPEMTDALEQAAAVLGDSRFTKSGGTDTLTIDLAALDMEELKDAYKEYQLVMKVDAKGGLTGTCRVETEAQSGVPGIRLAMDWTQSAGKTSLTMDLYVANLCQMKLELTATQQATSEKPMAQPPAGANVVDAPALLDP